MGMVMNILCNNNSVFDSITKTKFEIYGSLPVSKIQSPFNTEEYIYYATSTNFIILPNNLQSIIKNLNDFTISFWTKMLYVGHEGCYFLISFNTSNGYFGINIPIYIRIYTSSYNLSDSLQTNKWNYIEIYFQCLNSSKLYNIKCSLNGTQQYSNQNYLYNINDINLFTWIGSKTDYYNIYHNPVYDFCIHDKILHTSNFTPPTKPYNTQYKLFQDKNQLYSM